MNTSSNQSFVKYLFVAGTAATILSNSNFQSPDSMQIPTVYPIIKNVDDLAINYSILKHEIMPKINNYPFLNQEPIIQLKSVRKIKVKINEVKKLTLKSIENADGFI